MRKNYLSPQLTEFGDVRDLTQYGNGNGSSDTVYLANPAGTDAILFLLSNGVSIADSQVALASLIANSGGDSFDVALANISLGSVGNGGSFSPTLGAAFTA